MTLAKNEVYTGEQKAAALASMREGNTLTYIEKAFGIPRRTLSRWKKESGIGSTPIGKETQAEIGELVAEFLRSDLEALIAQKTVMTNPDWLEKQNAAGLAMLHGVVADKALRIIEAIAPEEDDEDE